MMRCWGVSALSRPTGIDASSSMPSSLCASGRMRVAVGDQRGNYAMVDAAFVKMTALAIVLISCVVMVQPY